MPKAMQASKPSRLGILLTTTHYWWWKLYLVIREKLAWKDIKGSRIGYVEAASL